MRNTILFLGFFFANHSFYLNAQTPQNLKESISNQVITPYFNYINVLLKDKEWDKSPYLQDFLHLFENGNGTFVDQDVLGKFAGTPKSLSILNYLFEVNRIWGMDPNASFNVGEYYFCREGEIYSVTLKKIIRGDAIIKNDKKDYIEVSEWVKFKITKKFKIISITESKEPPPDVDGDFVINDWERRCDICPKEKGLWDFDGCNDSDGDGICDEVDNCPELRGLKQYDGCPYAPLVGETPPFRPGKDFALFFAVDKYDEWDDLANPISDVEAIAKDLKEIFGFETEIVRNPDRKSILDKIEVYRQKFYDKDAQLLIFFSGHGEFNSATKQGYFIPKNGLGRDIYGDSYIEYEGLKRRIASLPCEHILLALDACYSGTANENIALKGKPGERPGDNPYTEREWYISSSLQNKTRIMLTSGAKVRTPDKSQFVAKFLEALISKGGNDRLINIHELLGYLTTASPKPVLSTFGDHELGGEFLFIEKIDGAKTFAPPAEFAEWNVAQYGMVLIHGGTFQMGSNSNKKDAKPVHAVTVGDFYLGKREVTNAEYCLFLNEKGNQSEGGNEWINLSGSFEQEKCRILQNGKQFSVEAGYDHFPVIYVSWYGAKAYCDWLTEKAGKKDSGVAYRLPTEAEWEYAAGNGSKHTRYSWGTGNPNGRRGGNIADLSAATILDAASVYRSYNDGFIFCAPVSTYDSSEFSLCDMTGNVREWCSDWYTGGYSENPQGSSQILKKVTRGGSWLTLLKDCEVASRSSAAQETSTCDIGFRVVLTTNH